MPETAAGAHPAPPPLVRHRLLGLPVDAIDMDAAVAHIAAAIRERRPLRAVVTNANKSWLATRDARLRAALEAADLVVPEWATSWAAGVVGLKGVAHVGGIRLMQRLLAEAPARGWSVYLLGARPEVVETLAARLRREQPALRLVGWHHGYLDEEAEAHVRRELADLRPDLLFAGMGSPRQELWLQALPRDAGPLVTLGVGGSFDVLSGHKRDTPTWMRGRGLEWLFRLSQDPRNLWRRYLVTNPWFVARVLAERVRRA